MKYLGTFLIILLANPLFAQVNNTVSGNIITDTQWAGTVFVTGDVTVGNGVTLTIEPGTRILFSPKTDIEKGGKQRDRIEFIVRGTLIANGQNGDGQITFTSNAVDQQMNDWYGLVFKSPTPSSLKHVLIEYAYSGITCYGSSPTIENCTIQYNYFAGVNCMVRAKPMVRSSMIIANGFAGVNVELAAAPVIENCIISQNANGVVVYDRSTADLGHENAKPGESSGGNHLFGNFEYNIYNRSQNQVSSQNNYWNTGDVAQISETIFDQTQNGQYGQVIYSPIVESQVPVITAIASSQKSSESESESENRDALPVQATHNRNIDRPAVSGNTPTNRPPALPAANNSPVTRNNTTVPNNQKPAETSTTNDVAAQPATNLSTQPNLTPNTPPATQGLTKPVEQFPSVSDTSHSVPSDEQLLASNSGEILPPTQDTVTITTANPVTENKPAAPRFKEPVIESFLDGGRRQYIRRKSPEYPKTFLKAGVRGTVLMEVLVGRDGRVRSYRVLKSDGDAFSDEAKKAIREYRYKPGTIEGKPVSFKIVERFEFKFDRNG